MISLEVNTGSLVSDTDNLLSGLKSIKSSSVLSEISKAVFTITAERFGIATDNYTRSNPKKMHHVYEWGKVGQKEGRLFTLERASIADGILVINTNFLPSRLPVPINPELLTPGKTGKVVTKRDIFANKASVMEDGKEISYVAKHMLAFAGTNGLVFIRPGTQVNILRPGGSEVKGAFGEFMLLWYTDNGISVLDESGIYERIANDVSVALSKKGAGVAAVRKAVANIITSSDLDKVVIQ